MSRTVLRYPLLLAGAALLSLACATGSNRAPHPGIASLWREFLEMPSERALALAGDPNREWVGAASGGHASRIEAEESVLSECRKRRLARRFRAPCRLYATGGEVVW